jgi:hypothetical protein
VADARLAVVRLDERVFRALEQVAHDLCG